MRLENVKNHTFFLPPKNKDETFFVRLSPLCKVNTEVRGARLLRTSGMDYFEFENSIKRINDVIRPLKMRMAY